MLLKDAGIEPEPRDVATIDAINRALNDPDHKEKEKLLKEKTSRELFSEKNFKTAKWQSITARRKKKSLE